MLCLLRDNRTYVQRRATLSGEEVEAIQRAFGDDPQGFIKIAMANVLRLTGATALIGGAVHLRRPHHVPAGVSR